jgi:hypothetical protein
MVSRVFKFTLVENGAGQAAVRQPTALESGPAACLLLCRALSSGVGLAFARPTEFVRFDTAPLAESRYVSSRTGIISRRFSLAATRSDYYCFMY